MNQKTIDNESKNYKLMILKTVVDESENYI